MLFNKCKDKDNKFNAIFLNGNGPFKRGCEESHLNSIVRLIANQLISENSILEVEDEKTNLLTSYLKCDEDVLTNYIDQNCVKVIDGNTQSTDVIPTVLFIDELNSISDSRPLDVAAANYLKREWLDKEGRFLVFSTHIPYGISKDNELINFLEAEWNPNMRTTRSIKMPCSNLDELLAIKAELYNVLSFVKSPEVLAVKQSIKKMREEASFFFYWDMG